MRLPSFVIATAIAAALAIPATSFAQTAATPSATPLASPAAKAPAVTAPAARHIGANDLRASKMIGAAVYDTADQKIGSIGDLVVDHDGRIGEVVIGVGAFLGGGDKNVAVKMSELKHGKDNRFVLNTTKDALKQMAGYDFNAEPARSGSSTHQ